MSFVKSLTRLPRGDSSTRSILTVLLTFALAVSGAIVAPSANAAAPASPTSFTSTSFNDNGNSYDLRINFNRPDSSTVTLTRILYQSSSSAPWTYCRTQNGYTTCVWDETSSEVVIAKESTNSASLTKTTTYDFRFKLCTGGSSITDTADQVDCTPVYIVNYNYSTGGVIQSVSTPSISTNDTITTGATGATINVTGNDFSPSVTSSNFTITLGTTSLSLSNFSSPDSRTAIFTFSGTVNYGNLTIRAETSAYATTPSSVSNTLTISAPNIAPNAPTQLDSTTVTGTDVGLTWIAPSANGGSAVNGYVIYKKLGSGGTWETVTTTSNTNTTYTLTGLTSASNYYFKVAAKNSFGTGLFTSDFGPVTTGSAPLPPETPTAVAAASPTSTSLTLTWAAPTNNGGSIILDYVIQKSVNNGSSWDTVTASATTGSATSGYTVSGLNSNTSYVFRVAARNSVNTGPFSDSSTAVSTSAPSSTPAPAPEVEFAPVITDVSKLKVCARGHENFVIRGNHFRNAAVTIDGIQVSVKGKSDNVINISFGETPAGKKKITVTNSAGSASIEIEFKLVDKTAFKVFDIPYIYKGGSFEYQFEAFGENTYRITGNLPDGLVLDAENGIIYGVPTEEGKFNFVLHADGLCGNDVDVIKLDIDKAIPNAISYRIKFPNKKNKKIVGTEQFELKKFLKMVKEISPKQIEPVIYITGGSPEDESDVDSTSAKDRRDSLCDIMINQDVLGQTVLGLFDGEEDEIEIFVYWPVVR